MFIIPIFDRVTWVDLREKYLEIPHQTAITQDNAPISIDFIIFNKVVDAVMSVLQVQNFAGAAQNIAATILRSVVGDMMLDDVLSKRGEMNQVLQVKLDEVTERWGVKVTNVEVREIIPPPAVAAVTVAEGNKQAAILQAEGDRQAAILRAEGFSLALDKIFQIAKTVDANTMSLQYLDALKQIGSSPSTKFVVPMELANLLSGVVGLTGRSFGDGEGGGRRSTTPESGSQAQPSQ